MRTIWNNSLGRELLLILIVKIIAIFAIWWVFFRPVVAHPPLNADQVSTALVSKPPTVTQPAVTPPAPRSHQDD
ncbi:cytochrome oxidase putative small subunit CydP [Sulfuriferula thiophila]|uniref:cytochrome oxidase putative small subunit CydP n=1 Tax=Sulfuriferula thiophila TaxID=1781211 RepID=UPI00351F5E2D